MNTRRNFLHRLAGVGTLFSISPLAAAEDLSEALVTMRRRTPLEVVNDEELWARIAQAYTVSPAILNLNNGGVSPQPKIVQDAVDRYYHLSNETPTYYMWQILDKGREPIRKKLADLAGTSPDEVAINRNTTEALATICSGLSLQKGDEIVMSHQDYPNMVHAWKQRGMRDGITIKWLNFELPIEDEDVFVDQFLNATTARTRIWHITHMINWTGQLLPVTRLCEEARKRNILTVVDGAHTFAQLDYKITDFSPDYFGTSLHKWLCAPFGTGLLYVSKKNIAGLYPLFPNDDPRSSNIRKFETLGTRSFAPEQAIGQAIDFHLAIGAARKEARLRYLKDYWCEKLANHPKITLHVSLNPAFSCALGSFSIAGMDPATVSSRLFSEHQIHTTAIKWANISVVRVTPHVYTSTKDLDRFIEAVERIAKD